MLEITGTKIFFCNVFPVYLHNLKTNLFWVIKVSSLQKMWKNWAAQCRLLTTQIIRTAGKTTTTVAKVHICYCGVAAQLLKGTGTSALFSLIQKDSTLWDTSSFLKKNQTFKVTLRVHLLISFNDSAFLLDSTLVYIKVSYKIKSVESCSVIITKPGHQPQPAW